MAETGVVTETNPIVASNDGATTPETVAYNIAVAFKIDGPLTTAATYRPTCTRACCRTLGATSARRCLLHPLLHLNQPLNDITYISADFLCDILNVFFYNV